MRLKRVDPHKIRIPEVRVTAQMTAETAEQFASSVKEVGIDEPIKVFEVEGELWLSDGLHRLQQALSNNLPQVDVTVREGNMVDVMCNNLMSGHLRGKHPISQMRRVIEELYKTYKIGIEDIVKRTGFTREYTENLLIISELTPLILEALDQEKIGLGIALMLAKIKDPAEQEKHFWMQQNYRLSQDAFKQYLREYDAAVKAQQTPLVAPVERPIVHIKCVYCGDEYLPEELASMVTCKSCAGIMYSSIAAARRDAATNEPANQKPPEGTGVDSGASQ